ncbi:hypothetical protein [Neptunomonas marina]|uniref:Uncharacterized protein n=1 Tax=Neptunomonas marina TaxID=1815562 RepID=A0A437QE79_9GAMM|nr:hypothetical protein [Neptunomonas marina]RVU32739.1 hypothetical protein EOE65_03525 [Neptunomonas marina]
MSDVYTSPNSYNEITGCTPDSNTEALLITRNATIAGNGAQWLSYLNNGGVIITEYNNPEPVYNELYGTSYTNDSAGDCRDMIMPSTIVNASDPFWVATGGITPVPDSEDSCGSDLADIVAGEGGTVIALGERTPEGTTSLAYRSQGLGVLFLTGADWQDSSTASAGAEASSAQLFGHMIAYSSAATSNAIPVLPAWAMVPLLGLIGLGARKHLKK